MLIYYRKAKDREKPKEKPKWKVDKEMASKLKEREVPQYSSALFFKYNTQLGPPYYVIVDTNFVNFSIKNKIDLVQGMMDCLYAKCKCLSFFLYQRGDGILLFFFSILRDLLCRVIHHSILY